MKHTITLPPAFFPAARVPMPATLSATRGQRQASTPIPDNKREPFQASQDCAWNHSAAAGVLWENGFRCSRAVKLAEEFFPLTRTQRYQTARHENLPLPTTAFGRF